MRPRERQSDSASGSNRFRVCKSWTQLYCSDRIRIPLSFSLSCRRFMFLAAIGLNAKTISFLFNIRARISFYRARESASRSNTRTEHRHRVLTGHASYDHAWETVPHLVAADVATHTFSMSSMRLAYRQQCVFIKNSRAISCHCPKQCVSHKK